MQISDDMVRVAAEAMATEAGDDPRALTYAREMKCTSHDREPKERWEFWVPFARAAISAALDAIWKENAIVPREPTTVQANAGVACDDLRTGYETVRHIYRHMITASPYAPHPPKVEG